ncbi:3-deoxy-manno-octulosonate cytidylyltransferase [Cyanobium sp. NIES-981]|uniref:3-deoxy-manno-octulosonate cytidylyltransferase n=1 Tax=Cyanobium sp. NIES-981 TaxID=1851505 RepID=UPI000B34C860|nr:3-deoxy-manno-octulosonate cytidylyltransferase [Cyanobium sp. NIES-981]
MDPVLAASGSPSRVVVAVPARLASSRLPGKVLADIAGRPMLQHVVERCRLARGVDALVVCTDSPEVAAAAGGWGVQVLITPASCSSGSERLAAVIPALLEAGGGAADQTLVINVQGDQPLLDPAIIEAMVERFAALGRPAVLTPVYALPAGKVHDPNVVKVLLAADGRAITFSRSALPHVRDLAPELWTTRTTYWGHVGLYGYRGDVLAGWHSLPHSSLEDLEKLEQLRLIDAGVPITTFVVEGDSLSVDTPEQLEQARRLVAAAA